MLGLSQSTLGDAVGVTFQQVQKYEKGSNRVGANRLQQIAHVLQVPVGFFFEDALAATGQKARLRPESSPRHAMQFLTTQEGLALVTAFMKVTDSFLAATALVGALYSIKL